MACLTCLQRWPVAHCRAHGCPRRLRVCRRGQTLSTSAVSVVVGYDEPAMLFYLVQIPSGGCGAARDRHAETSADSTLQEVGTDEARIPRLVLDQEVEREPFPHGIFSANWHLLHDLTTLVVHRKTIRSSSGLIRTNSPHVMRGIGSAWGGSWRGAHLAVSLQPSSRSQFLGTYVRLCGDGFEHVCKSRTCS
jgi:hypothetical protein